MQKTEKIFYFWITFRRTPESINNLNQSIDHGIINNVKIHYRRRILRKTLVSLEDDDAPAQITL